MEYLNICQSTQSEHDPGRLTQMDTRMHHRHQTITATTRPQATCSQSNWCLLPVWCTTAVSGSVHTTRLLNYPEAPRQRSRTVRHNRAAQAEITTPYPGPRFPRAATVAHCGSSSAGRERQSFSGGHPARGETQRYCEGARINAFG